MPSSQYKIPSKCQNINKFVPIVKPQIYTLSTYSSQTGIYTVVTINGLNFSIYGSRGYSTLNFVSYINIPIVFLGSSTMSFEVSSNAIAGSYSVYIENVIFPNPLISNFVTFTIT